METRLTSTPQSDVRVQPRTGSSLPSTIVGYASRFYDGTPGTQYRLFEGAYERIQRGAFDRALKERHDARGLFNHSPDNLLGRVSNGTLRLETDRRGLKYTIDVDAADPDHQRVVRKIQRGDLSGSSFSFTIPPGGDRWVREGKIEIREITDLQLYDVGPVTMPAYQATSADVRGAPKRWRSSDAQRLHRLDVCRLRLAELA